MPEISLIDVKRFNSYCFNYNLSDVLNKSNLSANNLKIGISPMKVCFERI